jgi:zinc protease
MNFKNKFFQVPLFVFLTLALALSASIATAADPVDYLLPNGLRVILIENHRAPVTSMLVWVKIGSRKERSGEHGLAHLMEHMMFKGTTTRGPGEIAREVEASGGQINAYTSFDQTVYYINMASRYTIRGLDILADMVFNPALDPVEFKREKEVVVEEIKRGEDNPDRKLSEKVFETAYQVHPYGRPIIGFSETVRNVSLDTAKAFHQRFYRPDNMVLVVAGDFNIDEIKPIIEKSYGQNDSGKEPKSDIPVEPPQKKIRPIIVREDVKTAQVMMGFHIPEFKHPDTIALDMLAEIMGEGRSSRLYSSLKRDKQLVHGISAGAYTPHDPGLFVVSAELDTDKTQPAISAIIREIKKLQTTPVTPQELARAKLNVQAYFIHSRATMSGEARTAASYQVLGGDWRAKDRYLADIENITADDIMAAAKKYLTVDNLTAGVMVPKDEAPNLTDDAIVSAVKTGEVETAPATAKPSETPAETKILEYKLDNKARLVVKPDPSLPLVSVRAAFLGGVRYETKDNNGINNFMAEIWDRGTTRLSAEELARQTENMAASISSFSGRNSFGLEAEFLAKFLDPGLDLFAEVLTQPAFSPDETEKARPVILAAIKRQQDQMPSRTFTLFAKTLYDGNPYSLNTLGTEDTVQKITAKDIRAYYEKYARPDNLVITVVGDVDPEHIKDRLNRLLADFQGKAASPPAIPAPKKWQGVREAEDKVEKAQTHLVWGYLAPSMASSDRYALEVLDSVLSGMGGRLFVELRDKQSLAYTVTSFYSPGLDTGAFGFYIAFDPAKYEQAREGFDKIITEITQKPITDQELAAAKEYILGSYDIGLQSYGAQASELAFNDLYDLGLDYSQKYIEGISKVTAEDVLKAAKKYLNKDQMVKVVVGPVS